MKPFDPVTCEGCGASFAGNLPVCPTCGLSARRSRRMKRGKRRVWRAVAVIIVAGIIIRAALHFTGLMPISPVAQDTVTGPQ